MRFFTRSMMGVFLAVVSIGLLAVAVQLIISATAARLAGDTRPPVADERVYTANIVTVEPATIAPVLTAYGEIRSRRTLELRSAWAAPSSILPPVSRMVPVSAKARC
ncbi:MAG: hypothetical protein HC871_09505 [Rhizobiales bacterium]|nr:hypothetical protein [Hyphomicrobiales bacterium]